MNSQNQTDKATARPWLCDLTQIKLQNNFVVLDTYLEGDATLEEAKSNAALIVRAVNEHEALNAVAEAAKYYRDAMLPIPDIKLKDGCLCAGCGAWMPKGHPEAHDHEDNCTELRNRSALFAQRSHNERHGSRILNASLSKLQSIREQK